MTRFLRYVVEKTLADDLAGLRERQIGIEVFERPADWDPKLDNIVRSEARRLRAKLEAYAASNDPGETVRITMPIGGYGVQFEERVREAPPSSQAAAPLLTEPGKLDKRTYRVRRWVWIATLSLIPLVLMTVYLWKRPRPLEDQFEIEPFSSEAGLQFSPVISPDGKNIAFVWNGGNDHYEIYSKSLGSDELHRLTQNPSPSSYPAWSRDGKQLAFFRESGEEVPIRESGGEAQLIVLDVATHRERLIRRIRNSLNVWGSSHPLTGCQTLSWNPNGDQLILTDPSGEAHGLISVSTTTGEQTAISKPGGSDQDCYSRLSPDGKTIAFIRFLSHAVGYLYTVDLGGNHMKRLTQEVRDLRGLDWTPDGRHLVFASKERGAYQLRMISAQGGESVPLPAATASASNPSVSPDGKFVAFVESRENWNVWRVEISEGRIGTPGRFLASTGKNHSPSFSPDGYTIAFVSDRSGSPEIWLCDADGQHLRQLTQFGGPWLGTIRWSPDGKSIVFDARPKGHSAIYTMDLSQGKPVLIEDQPFEVRRPSWSRDGRYIYFDTTRGGAPEIWRRDLKSNQNQVIATAGFMVGIESPDGKRLFYQESEQRHIWVSDLDGGSPRQLPEVHPLPDLDWAPVGNSVYFTSVSTQGTDILAFDLNTGKLTKLGHLDQVLALGTPSFAVSPNGRTLLYSTIDNSLSEIKLRRGVLPQ
jgi:Tol biopolymer transport system component